MTAAMKSPTKLVMAAGDNMHTVLINDNDYAKHFNNSTSNGHNKTKVVLKNGDKNNTLLCATVVMKDKNKGTNVVTRGKEVFKDVRIKMKGDICVIFIIL